MTFYDFYDALDNELNEVIAENPQDVRLHKGDDATRKAYAFMIWFLKFYGKRPIYNLNITDGDGDTSCDIIFSTFDNVGKKIFYIIQAKWNTRKNCIETLDSKSFKSTLDDFKLVYSGQKQFSSKNENFNKQYEALKQHLAENQYVKFVYLTLCQTNPSVSENVELFKKQYADLEIIDIQRLRRDFIETRYKQINPENPLEYDYNPEIETITIPIEQLEIEKNFLRVDAPFNSYTFLIRPKTIFELFEKYGFKLFFSNIRNPLIASDYNKQIEQTMLDAPSYFWYFNNGITAITRNLPKRINATAQQIEVTGLQIINGAQTVYSVYKTYKEAKNGKQGVINNALLQLRLVQSIDKNFDLDITRYTNQQNPTEPRDFWANDPIQVQLQNESFATNYWYEIRRGEFRVVPANVNVMSNEEYLEIYMEYNGYVGNGFKNQELWEIFYSNFSNDNLKFEDLLVAFKLKSSVNNLKEIITSGNLIDYLTNNYLISLMTSLNDLKVLLKNLFDSSPNKRFFDKIKSNENFVYKMIVFIAQLKEEYRKKSSKPSVEVGFQMVLNELGVKPLEGEIESIDWKSYFNIPPQ